MPWLPPQRLMTPLAQLRERTSVKWRAHPAEVLPAFIAELDVDAAEPIRHALAAAVERSDFGYTHAGGLASAFAGFAARRFGWTVDEARVKPVPDVMIGVIETLRTFGAAGKNIVVNGPVYPPFFETAREVGAHIVNVPLIKTPISYEIDLTALEAAFAEHPAAYLLCSPHNPVGRQHSADTLHAIATLAARHDVLVLCDEIHAPLALDDQFVPFLPIAEAAGARTVTFISASKAWNVAGLKCALALPSANVSLAAVPREVSYRVGHFGVIAAIAAWTHGDAWLDALLEHLRDNRAQIGAWAAERPHFAYTPPQASYLAWFDAAATGVTDAARTLLDVGRIAVVAGADFRGPATAFRLNFGTSRELLDEALTRIDRAFAG